MEYFKKYTGAESVSIVNALVAIGENSDYANRKLIAAANGIADYSGTSAQNLKLLSLLKDGILIKPDSAREFAKQMRKLGYIQKSKGLQGTKKAGTNPATRIALAITIEKIPTADHSGRQPQGEKTPYKNCQPSRTPRRVGDLFGCEDINISINNLKNLLKKWKISDAKTFAFVVSNNIGAEPSIERVKRAKETEEISYYLNLPQYSLRIGLHNLNAENYKDIRNRPENHAVTFKEPLDEDIFKPHKGVNVREYVYVYWTKERLKKVAEAILNLLETGVWDNSIAEPDYTNPKTDQSAPLSGANDNDNFKRWFSGSKVVDVDGNPLVVYHGTNAEFDTFDVAKFGLWDNGTKWDFEENKPLKDKGFFFTANKTVAKEHAEGAVEWAGGKPVVLYVYLQIKKPLHIQVDEFKAKRKGYTAQDWYDFQTSRIMHQYEAGDYDGIIVTNPIDESDKLFVVFKPNQIKSATRNNGHFSPESDSILEGVYGLLFDESDAQWNLTAEDIALINELQKEYSEQITANEPERNRRNAQLAYCLIRFLNGEADAVTNSVVKGQHTTGKAYIEPIYGKYDYIAEYFYHNPTTKRIVCKYVPKLKGLPASKKQMFNYFIELYKRQKNANTDDPNWFDAEELKHRLAEDDGDTAEKLLNVASAVNHGTGAKAFAEALSARYDAGEKFDWVKAKKIAEAFKIDSDNDLMQACELGLVLQARKIAQGSGTIRERYNRLVDLYGRQITIRPKDSLGKTLQQYSTPCPLAYLLGEWIKNNHATRKLYYEPTAGNGLLTIALPPNLTIVNELDKPRYNNLQKLGFHRVLNKDAATIKEGCVSGVIMNPPFDSLDKTDYLRCKGEITGRGEVEYVFERLDHKIAIIALSMMQDNGRATIIVGGKIAVKFADYKSTYWKNGALFGSWRTFITYLHRQYRIADVIYINGDLYAKQGTTFPIVVILIDGRTEWNAELNHQWHTFDEQLDYQIDTFNEFWQRMSQHIERDTPSDYAEKLKTAKAKATELYDYAVKNMGIDSCRKEKSK